MNDEQNDDCHRLRRRLRLPTQQHTEQDPLGGETRVYVQSNNNPYGQQQVDAKEREDGLPPVLVGVGLVHEREPVEGNEAVVEPIDAEEDDEEHGHRCVNEDGVERPAFGLSVGEEGNLGACAGIGG